MALFFFSANISSLRAQVAPCYVYDSIPYAPDSLTSSATVAVIGDDQFYPVIPIGFSFCFYGNTYSQCVIGANGIISFNIASAGAFCPWSISAPIPSPTIPTNCIFMPWEDLFLPGGGTIQYQLMGAAPYRRFVVAFTNVQFFTTGICPGDYYTGQAILFETLNSIEIHILNNSVCSAWNGGRAILGIQNSTGTDGITAYPDTAPPYYHVISNKGYRFYPICLCPYAVEELNGSENFQLQIFPNPSLNNVNITYELKQSSEMTINVYNALGELVAAPAQKEKQTSGSHKYNLSMNVAGIYFLKLQTADKILTRKFIVAK